MKWTELFIKPDPHACIENLLRDHFYVIGHPLILTDQLAISQPRGADSAHQMILAPLELSDLPTALTSMKLETLHM